MSEEGYLVGVASWGKILLGESTDLCQYGHHKGYREITGLEG